MELFSIVQCNVLSYFISTNFYCHRRRHCLRVQLEYLPHPLLFSDSCTSGLYQYPRIWVYWQRIHNLVVAILGRKQFQNSIGWCMVAHLSIQIVSLLSIHIRLGCVQRVSVDGSAFKSQPSIIGLKRLSIMLLSCTLSCTHLATDWSLPQLFPRWKRKFVHFLGVSFNK